MRLDEVRFVPAAQPPLRDAPPVAAARRLHWVRLAVGSEPGLVVDDRELRRAGPSYTVDTLESLRSEFPKRPLLLLLGMDAAAKLPKWHRWTDLIELAHLVFFNRPGDRRGFTAQLSRYLHGRQARDVDDLHARASGLWWRCVIPPLDISASRIRELVAGRRSLFGLVPEAVIRDFGPADLEALGRS